MYTVNIKILKNTPFDNQGHTLSIKEFRLKYGHVVTESLSEEKLIEFLNDPDNPYRNWFELIETRHFGLGECIWHEKLNRAFFVSHMISAREWFPNEVSVEAANAYPEIYKRNATAEEYEKFKLVFFPEHNLLVGKYKCYYFDGIWKEVKNIHHNVQVYFSVYNEHLSHFQEISVMREGETQNMKKYSCSLNGLKICSKRFTHDELTSIARILGIIP
jgi:hypothetical protein